MICLKNGGSVSFNGNSGPENFLESLLWVKIAVCILVIFYHIWKKNVLSEITQLNILFKFFK